MFNKMFEAGKCLECWANDVRISVENLEGKHFQLPAGLVQHARVRSSFHLSAGFRAEKNPQETRINCQPIASCQLS